MSRRPSERFALVCITEHDSYGRGISIESKIDLHIVEHGSLTAVRYVKRS